MHKRAAPGTIVILASAHPSAGARICTYRRGWLWGSPDPGGDHCASTMQPIDTTHRSPNHEPRTRPIALVVLHATAGSLAGSLAWLCTPASKVSTHYLIAKSGHVYQLVDDDAVAWHAGRAEWHGETAINDISLGVELENANDGRDPYPAAQVAALTTLVRALFARYGPLALARHLDVARPVGRKSDPAGFPWESWRAAFAADPPIVGPATCTLEQAAALLLSVPHPGYTRMDISVIVGGYFDICARGGVDPCVVVAQMAHETGCLTSWWSQRPRRNPAGIGVTGREMATKPKAGTWQKQNNVWLEGCAFGGWVAEAIPAHVGRLLAYAVKPDAATPAQAALIETALAVRPLLAEYVGAAPTVGGLAGRWAVPGTTYRAAIVAIMERMRGL